MKDKYKITHKKITKFQSRWQQQIRVFYSRIRNLQGNPKYIARGLAAGVFAGLFPLFGLQTIIGVALATLLKGNKLVAAAGTWVSNPLTYIPILLLNFQVGRWLLGKQNLTFTVESTTSLQNFLTIGREFIFVLFVGCFVVGLVCAIATYYLCIPLVRLFHRRAIHQQLSQNRYFLHHQKSSSHHPKHKR